MYAVMLRWCRWSCGQKVVMASLLERRSEVGAFLPLSRWQAQPQSFSNRASTALETRQIYCPPRPVTITRSTNTPTRLLLRASSRPPHHTTPTHHVRILEVHAQILVQILQRIRKRHQARTHPTRRQTAPPEQHPEIPAQPPPRKRAGRAAEAAGEG